MHPAAILDGATPVTRNSPRSAPDRRRHRLSRRADLARAPRRSARDDRRGPLDPARAHGPGVAVPLAAVATGIGAARHVFAYDGATATVARRAVALSGRRGRPGALIGRPGARRDRRDRRSALPARRDARSP